MNEHTSCIPWDIPNKTREQIVADFRSMFDTALFMNPVPTHVSTVTHEEITAHLHRLVNPTPADRAASMLNGERVARLTPRA